MESSPLYLITLIVPSAKPANKYLPSWSQHNEWHAPPGNFGAYKALLDLLTSLITKPSDVAHEMAIKLFEWNAIAFKSFPKSMVLFTSPWSSSTLTTLIFPFFQR